MIFFKSLFASLLIDSIVLVFFLEFSSQYYANIGINRYCFQKILKYQRLRPQKNLGRRGKVDPSLIFNLSFKKKKGRSFFIGRVEISSPRIVKNLPCTYNKLHCKGEPYRLSGYRDPLIQTKKLITLYNRMCFAEDQDFDYSRYD